MSLPRYPTNPDVLDFIALTASFYPTADASKGWPPHAFRDHYNAMCAALHPGRPQDVDVSDLVIPSTRVSGLGIPIRVYEPTTPGTKLPAALLYVHGGGWVLGDLESHDDVCSALAKALPATVIAVDYRLAPEHLCPAALDDVADAAKWVADRDGPFVIAGDSAGGHLSAGYCWRADTLGLPKPIAQALVYPALRRPQTDGSYAENAQAPALTAVDCTDYFGAYLGGPIEEQYVDTPHLALFPGEVADVSIYPPTICTAAGFDPLRDDAHAFAARLRSAGVACTLRDDPELIHGHLRARHSVGPAREHFDWLVVAIRAAVNGQPLPADVT